jgi:prepilin-type N-terminal cleavage/methylation domain-containing protein
MNITAFKRISIKGFTLLEIIVSMIIAAIMGAVMVQFMGTSMLQSTKPLVLVKNEFLLNEIIEKITADYKKLLATDGTPLETLRGYIENGNVEANEPFYGPYTCLTEYVVFNAGNEVPDTGGDHKLLKVTLTCRNQTLVTLFAQ